MADKLCAFHALLVQANARMNLTRVSDDPDEAIDRNYLDSLAPLELVRGAQSCVDVGSGAGFPGIPLSIFLPQTRFVLLEAQARCFSTNFSLLCAREGYEQAQGETVEAMEKVREMMREEREREEAAARELAEKRKEP